MTELQHARLLGRAVRRWPVPEHEKLRVMETLFELASNGVEESTRIAACRTIIAAEAQNQSDEHKLVDVRIKQEHARLDAIAAELGIDRGLIESAERQAGGCDDGSTSASC